MDPQFWINAWNEGRTNFHQQEFHEKLMEYFPTFNPKAGQSVLVPLCGKTKDLFWLQDLKLKVHGVELANQAVEEFFKENELPFNKIHEKDFDKYTYKDITISCGNFFKLEANNTYDFIYDRASLVALPVEMRKDYAQVIKRSLKLGGKCLLISYEYDQSKLDGPPFSVEADEIHALYQDQCSIKLMESKQSTKNSQRLSALDSLKQTVYLLEKIKSQTR